MVTARGTGSADRGGVGGREEDVERVPPGGLPQVRLLPPRPASGVGADEPDVNRARREREGQRFGRIEHEAPVRARRAAPSTARAVRRDSARLQSLRRAVRARRCRLTVGGSRARSAPLDRRCVGLHQSRGAGVPAEPPRLNRCRLPSSAPASSGLVQDPFHGGRHPGDVVGVDDEAGVTHNFRERAARRHDDRHADRHGLERR